MLLEEDIETLLARHNAKDLLRFITCGNVDDGKSTLIGRLLLESGAVYDDQIQALQAESNKRGTTDGRIDTALLLDGLEDERQQGITIDVAYRYFSAKNRKFIIADTPGHEQFTRNMATGASTAQLAILLIDATKGISTQTRRHAFIVSLLGIRQVVLAVNKMDLVDFDQNVFQQITCEFDSFAANLPNMQVGSIPLSALDGDNVTQHSARTPWYCGPTLLEQLCTADVGHEEKEAAFRFPVQWVNRPHANFRGFCGTIAAGSVRVGDELMSLPSGTRARVKSIETMDGQLSEAEANESITISLDREIDVSRGDMLVTPAEPPEVLTRSSAILIWMSAQPLVLDRQYWLKHAARRTTCEVKSINYRTDINTLQRLSATTLRLNEIGCCQCHTTDPLMIEPYSRNREIGSFILVDRITHETVAAGMFVKSSDSTASAGHWDELSSTTPPKRATTLVNAEVRSQRLQQRPVTILITGLSSSGKTSVAMELEKLLFERGKTCIMLDGQSLRLGISRDLAFSAEERSENLRRAAEIAKLVNDAGQICIAAFVAPMAWARGKVKQLIGPEQFFHVHLETSIETCRARDLSGQYVAADKGEIHSFPGVTFPYEQPRDADMTANTEYQTAAEIAQAIMLAIEPRWLHAITNLIPPASMGTATAE